jgi:hypothetical protein
MSVCTELLKKYFFCYYFTFSVGGDSLVLDLQDGWNFEWWGFFFGNFLKVSSGGFDSEGTTPIGPVAADSSAADASWVLQVQ